VKPLRRFLYRLFAFATRRRDEQRLPLLDDFLQDVRYTFRQLRNSPMFTLTATISLAMGIGANAGVFTIVERLLLRPLSVSNPHELVYVTDERILTQPSPRFSYPFYAVLRQNMVLNGVAARSALGLNVTVNGQTLRARPRRALGSDNTPFRGRRDWSVPSDRVWPPESSREGDRRPSRDAALVSRRRIHSAQRR
jgi:hypothetical protein